MLTTSLVLTQSPLPLASVKIGSLVLDYRTPHQDSHILVQPELNKDYYRNPRTQYKTLLTEYKRTALRLSLTQLFEGKISLDADNEGGLEAENGYLYDLCQPKPWFKEICEDARTRDWLQQAATVKPKTAFLISGYATLIDATYTQKVKKGNETSSDANVSGDLILSAVAAAPVVTGGMLDSGVGFNIERAKGGEIELKYPGEYVFAVAYKKVVFDWRSSRQLRGDTASLDQKVQWFDLTLQRGDASHDTENDIVTAFLTDRLGILGDEFSDEDMEFTYLIPDNLL